MIHIITDRQYETHAIGAVIARQGDVILEKAGEVTVGELLEENEKNRVVLAHGEVTGHAHAFYYEEVTLPEPKKAVQLFSLPDQGPIARRLLRLAERCFLRHEEHETISLPKGDYFVKIQHEGDEINELRRVAD